MYAAGVAANYGATIQLLHVVTPVVPTAYDYALDTTEIMNSIEAGAAEELKELVGKAKNAGGTAESILRIGDVYDEIKRTIDAVRPDLIVMGTHGRRGVERWFLGSTTEKLLRHTPVPLITISAAGEKSFTPPQFKRILVATDFSDGTPTALAHAFSVAQENESRVTLLHVVHRAEATDLSDRYRESLICGVRKQLDDMVPAEARHWSEVATRVETGVPYRMILRIIEEERPDLLVMNIHGKGALDRALLGSTAERVVRAASCPVMMIPPRRMLKRRARPGGIRAVA